MKVVSNNFFDDRRATKEQNTGAKKSYFSTNDRRSKERDQTFFQRCWYLQVDYLSEELSAKELIKHFCVQ